MQSTDDLVAQLREYGSCGMVFEAADRIEKLEAALREIAWIATPDHAMARSRATHIARKALEGKDD